MPKITEEQKEKWFGKARNERRRKQYASSTEYRKRVLQQSKERYRAHSGNERERNCPTESGYLAMSGDKRLVVIGGASTMRVCFTTEELGDALGGYNKVNMYRWHADGRLPRPVYACDKLGIQMVYTLPEVKAIANVLNDHLSNKRYYTYKDLDTITSMSSEVGKARGKLAV
jgi:hypothetical protein